MQPLDPLLANWRRTMADTQLSEETLAELEDHLRAKAGRLIAEGAQPSAAVDQAIRQLGDCAAMVSEFQKARRVSWLPLKLIPWIGVILAGVMVLVLFRGVASGRFGLLLAGHVFLVTLGYTTTFLIGALGICYVAQRCTCEFSSMKLENLRRSSARLARIAVVLTAGGVLLGMIWAKINWGRYWDWDAKEIGGLSVLLWQLAFLAALRATRDGSHSPVLATLVGNIVVLGAWFGPDLLTRMDAFSGPAFSIVVGAVIVNLMLLVVGVFPAAWLRILRTR
jgi:hypothetical protein